MVQARVSGNFWGLVGQCKTVAVTVEQSLVGAMGCASWRARHGLLEYADLAPVGDVIRGGRRRAPSVVRPRVLGLNEVGVTDAVMATISPRDGPGCRQQPDRPQLSSRCLFSYHTST